MLCYSRAAVQVFAYTNLRMNSLAMAFLRQRGRKISTWRLFNYTNLHGRPARLPAPSPLLLYVRILLEQGKAVVGKAVARELRASLSLLAPSPSPVCRNLPVFLAPPFAILRTQVPPSSTSCSLLTLISRMRYNREHNLEIAGNNSCNGG